MVIDTEEKLLLEFENESYDYEPDDITLAIDEICDILNEGSMLDSIKYGFDNLKATFSKNKREFLDKYYKKAMEAEDYANKVIKYKNTTAKGKRVFPIEYETYFIYCGSFIVTGTKNFNATWLSTVINFKNVLRTDNDDVKEYYKDLVKRSNPILQRHPSLHTKVEKGLPEKCAEALIENVKIYKKFIKEYIKVLDMMEQSINEANIILKNEYENLDSDKIKLMKKLFKLQKKIYAHDTLLTMCAARSVIKQSDELKKFINKYSVSESVEYIDKLCREEKGDTMNESVEYIDEGAIKKFFKKMDSKWVKNDYYVDYLTKEEFETVIDIIKTTFKKYEMVDKNIWYNCDTYDKYKKANKTQAYVADFDYSYFTTGRAGLNGVERQFHEALSEIKKGIKEAGIKATVEYMPVPSDNYNTIILYSEKRKSKEERKRQFANESSVVAVDEGLINKFFKKKGEEYYIKGAYAALSNDEFNKCMNIINRTFSKYKNAKKFGSIKCSYKEYLSSPVNPVMIGNILLIGNSYMNIDTDTVISELLKFKDEVNKEFSDFSLDAKLSYYDNKPSVIVILSSTKEKKSDKESTNESTVVAVDEVFGIRSKEERQAERRKLDEVELAYDRKFNSTCLRISGYPVERLEGTLSKCKSDLEAAKQEKKSAKDRYSKLEAQVKIDYYDNLSNKIVTMIKKKKSSSK